MIRAIVGAPGTGKTTLALTGNGIVLSPWAEVGEVRVPPGPGNLQTAIATAVRHGQRVIVVDEIEAYVLADESLQRHLPPLTQQARHYRLELTFTSKRPSAMGRVGRAFFAGADEIVLFRLADPRDAAIFKPFGVDPTEIISLQNFTYITLDKGVRTDGVQTTEKP